MRSFLAGVRIQFWLIRRQPDSLLTLCTMPFTAVILLSVVIHATRPDLVANALLAPALIGLWGFSTGLASEVMQAESWNGTLEPAMATPSDLHPMFFGRICAVMGLGVLPLAETWLLGKVFFGVAPVVHHPWLFAATMAFSIFAMAGTSMLLAAALLLTRNGGIYQNFLSFPIYILSGVMVPVTFLPAFLQPLSHLVFLSWSANLMRDCLAPGAVSGAGWRLLAIAVLGVAGLVGGRLLLRAVLRRVHELGSVTYA